MSANKLDVAFVWNQHQPYYRDTGKGELIMPWVRLHGAKDYYSMAAILKKYPGIRQTFNLTPSLLAQLEYYLHGKADYYQKVLKPVEELSSGEKQYLLHHYFDIQWEKVIARYPRYLELLECQGRVREPGKVKEAVNKFTAQDYLDLQVWFNLVWIDPELRKEDTLLGSLERKGANYNHKDLDILKQKQLEILSRVLSVHRDLFDKGQIEMMNTPYYHPIMPLLIDNHSALRASPGLSLPGRFQYPQDACAQIKKGREQFRRLLGREPRGIWPPEQAVSPEVIPMFVSYGFIWTISDEQILARSMGEEIVRDGYGHVLNGDLLYRPYRVKAAGAEMDIIFRDHHLSDRIGFEYQNFPPDDAAADLVNRLKKIRADLSWSPHRHLVTISLDGENAWEWYRGDKGPFLNSLYRRLSEDPYLNCVTVSEHLAANPPRRSIDSLHTGSWVDQAVTRWIGSENKNKLWNYLLKARAAVDKYARSGKVDRSNLDRAMENIYIAEGSDFPWWIDSMPYYLAAPFDALFRKHLANVYRSIGVPVPSHLSCPLMAPEKGKSSPAEDPLAGPVAIVKGSGR